MIDDPTAEQAKELYAYFGLAYYCSSVLEHGIVNAIMILELMEGRGGAKTQEEWETIVDKHYEESFEKTLGKLKGHLARHQKRYSKLSSIIPDLEQCVGERNFLAHHFWREHATSWFTALGRQEWLTG